jgi:hypothetical protein
VKLEGFGGFRWARDQNCESEQSLYAHESELLQISDPQNAPPDAAAGKPSTIGHGAFSRASNFMYMVCKKRVGTHCEYQRSCANTRFNSCQSARAHEEKAKSTMNH